MDDTLADILIGISEINLSNFQYNEIDAFRDVYEYLISNYVSNLGKSGRKFFTFKTVSKLLDGIVTYENTHINRV